MSCELFLLKSHPYLGATLDNIVKCSCCNCACVKYKCPSSIREEEMFTILGTKQHFYQRNLLKERQ